MLLNAAFFYANQERDHRPCGCKEKITWKLLSYILWHFRKEYHPKVLDRLECARQAGKDVRIVRSFKDVECFIDQL